MIRDNGKEEAERERIPYTELRAAGIDPDIGLGYCQQDRALYLTLLREYAGSEEEKAPDMQRYFEARDWKQYRILAHALKSSSRMIGTVLLAEKAAALEAAKRIPPRWNSTGRRRRRSAGLPAARKSRPGRKKT